MSRFTFVDDPLNSTEAEAYCQLLGGHLASYLNLEEQVGGGRLHGALAARGIAVGAW